MTSWFPNAIPVFSQLPACSELNASNSCKHLVNIFVTRYASGGNWLRFGRYVWRLLFQWQQRNDISCGRSVSGPSCTSTSKPSRIKEELTFWRLLQWVCRITSPSETLPPSWETSVNCCADLWRREIWPSQLMAPSFVLISSRSTQPKQRLFASLGSLWEMESTVVSETSLISDCTSLFLLRPPTLFDGLSIGSSLNIFGGLRCLCGLMNIYTLSEASHSKQHRGNGSE